MWILHRQVIANMRPRVKNQYVDFESAIKDISKVIDQILRGQTDNVGEVTLTLSATTTLVTDARVGTSSVITFAATDATSAAELANLYVSTTNGSFTITHSNAGTTRTFKYVING